MRKLGISESTVKRELAFLSSIGKKDEAFEQKGRCAKNVPDAPFAFISEECPPVGILFLDSGDSRKNLAFDGLKHRTTAG